MAGVPLAATIMAVAATGVAVAATVVVVVATTIEAVVVIAPSVATPASIVAVSATAIVAAVPRAGANKDTADKVVRTVKAIGRAFVGVVVVVTVRANGSCADVAVARSDSNANGKLEPWSNLR